MLSFTCPKCAAGYKVSEQFAGRETTCRTCGIRMQVPPMVRNYGWLKAGGILLVVLLTMTGGSILLMRHLANEQEIKVPGQAVAPKAQAQAQPQAQPQAQAPKAAPATYTDNFADLAAFRLETLRLFREIRDNQLAQEQFLDKRQKEEATRWPIGRWLQATGQVVAVRRWQRYGESPTYKPIGPKLAVITLRGPDCCVECLLLSGCPNRSQPDVRI
jgi:hypothetical protein